jgi:hypothetical protein
MRKELFALHLPNPERVRADFAVLADLSRGLSGGDILNIGLNAIYAGSTDANPERWEVTQTMIEAEIKKARKAKAEHSGERRKEKRVIGLGVGLSVEELLLRSRVQLAVIVARRRGARGAVC